MSQKQPYTLSDSAIIELYWARDEAAIRQTDIKYRNYLIKVAYNVLADEQDSEECLNDTYLHAWNAMPPQRPRVLQAFLATVTRHLAIDKYRHRHGRKSVPSAFTISLQDLEGFDLENTGMYTEQQARELASVISAWMHTLDERTRYIFMSRYFEARPIDEITQLLGCSRSTVNAEIAYIKASLRQALEKEGYTV